MQGEKVQRWMVVVGESGEEGLVRFKCLRPSQGAGRSRNMALAFTSDAGVSSGVKPSWQTSR